MKQFAFNFCGRDSFISELESFKTSGQVGTNLLFHIFSEDLSPDIIKSVGEAIEKVFPDSPYAGCTTSGNIIDCELSGKITVVCTVFELSSTKVRLYSYDSEKESTEEIAKHIAKETENEPWVKAVEIYYPIPLESTTKFCDCFKNIRRDIQIFGGVSCSDDITKDDCMLFAKGCEPSPKKLIAVFYGGEEFYAYSLNITGWKPLGRNFTVTSSDGAVIKELNGIPAYEVYRKYLNIRNDENFFYNTLEFPLFYEHNDTIILRCPVSANPDGSINVTSDVDVGSTVRISYGDPATIVESIKQESAKVYSFEPELIHIFSCAARRTFWSDKEPTFEIQPFKDAAQSCGFFSHGEFLRTGENLNQHNVTLVIAAMREGGKKGKTLKAPELDASRLLKVPLVSRLANFIGSTSLELEEMNSRLEEANHNLKMATIIDGLTGLYNRKEIQSQIEAALENVGKETFSLVMLDIDNFKQVNDTYGHQEGDAVIKALSHILRNNKAPYMQKVSSGRWGGEEFMMLLHDTDSSTAAIIADLIRQCFENTTYPVARMQTASLGVTQVRADDTIDTVCSRVDTALYKAKKTGKNKVVVI